MISDNAEKLIKEKYEKVNWDNLASIREYNRFVREIINSEELKELNFNSQFYSD